MSLIGIIASSKLVAVPIDVEYLIIAGGGGGGSATISSAAVAVAVF
jgi:hypothetical protein